MTEEQIAIVCHEANRALCEMQGDFSQKPWAQAQPWERESKIKGIAFAIANPDADDSAQHDAWQSDKRNEGWVHGSVKDVDAKTHPCLVPFEELPPEQQAKDRLFRAIVRALAPSVGKLVQDDTLWRYGDT